MTDDSGIALKKSSLLPKTGAWHYVLSLYNVVVGSQSSTTYLCRINNTLALCTWLRCLNKHIHSIRQYTTGGEGVCLGINKLLNFS